MATDTAGAAGTETSTLESSSPIKTNSFVVFTVDPSTMLATALSTEGTTSCDGIAPDEPVLARSPATSGEQLEKLPRTELSSENEGKAILGVQGVAEHNGELQHSSKEPESNAPQVMEPEQQPEATKATAAATEVHEVGVLVKGPSTPSSSPKKITATTIASKALHSATTPTTSASSQQLVATRANQKTPDSHHPKLASETPNAGNKSVNEPDRGSCDVCQRTFVQEDLTEIFVELRKSAVEDSTDDPLSPFMLCPECKEPLLQVSAPGDSSSGMQRDDIVAKLHERALNTQPAPQMCDEVEAKDNGTAQAAERPMSKRVLIKLVRGKPSKERAAVKKCCVPNCTNQSDTSTDRPLSFHKFPRSTAIKKQWAKAIGRAGWLPASTTVICSDHFRPDDFTDGIPGSGNLKSGIAVPSIFKAAVATEGASSDALSPEVESVLYSNTGKAVVSLFQRKTPAKVQSPAKTCAASKSTGGTPKKRTLTKESSPVEQKKKKKLTVMDMMEVETSSFWLKTLSNRSVNFVHIVHRPMPCITRSVTVSPDMSVMVAIESARLSLLPCGTTVPSTIDSVETLQDLLDRVEMLDDTERIDNWQLRRQSTLKLVAVLLQEVCHNVGNADSQYDVLSSLRDQVKDLL